MQRCRGRLTLKIKWQSAINKEQNPCIKISERMITLWADTLLMTEVNHGKLLQSNKKYVPKKQLQERRWFGINITTYIFRDVLYEKLERNMEGMIK